MDTTPGTPCSVLRWRCICKEGEWPPNRPLEAFWSKTIPNTPWPE